MFSKLFVHLLVSGYLLASFAAPALAVTPGINWKDSYSVNGQCYCDTTYDHDAGTLIVDTPQGEKTTLEICETIGPGPGADGNPVYNDLQCGNGPGNGALDEDVCPGRVDIGKEGCSVIGPTWNLEIFFPAPEPPATTDGATDSASSTTAGATTAGVSTDTTEGSTTGDAITNEPNSEDVSRTPPADSFQYSFNGFSSKDSRWVLINENSIANANGPDPDGAHLSSTTNNAYLELLPDTKFNNSDQANSDNVWPTPGNGPQIHYTIDFTQAGVYEVYFRSFSNNQFDDSIHIGFDGIWPESGRDAVGCSIRNQWVWNHCEQTAPPTLTIPTSGVHTIQFAARDDGFEFDQFALRLRDPIAEPTTGTTDTTETEQITNTPNTEIEAEPELGQAILVGGSFGFISQAATVLTLSLIGFGVVRLRRKTN